jgi:hypothetical protein
MSTRPSSSWPWLDDALIELVDAGVFEDDPFFVADTAGSASASASGIATWLGSVELADLTDPALVGALDAGAVDGGLGLGSPAAASAGIDDPFHFEPASPDAVAGADVIAEILLGAIDAAPEFVTDPMPMSPAVDDAIPAGTALGAPDGAAHDLDHVHDPLDADRFAPTIDLTSDLTSGLTSDPTSGLGADGSPSGAGHDGGGTTDDASGDLDDFDGVDGVDDFDGL